MSAPRVFVRLFAVAAVAAGLVLAPALPAAAFTISGPGGAVPPPPSASKVDPTTTKQAKTSRPYRESVALSTWVGAPYAKMVAKRESGGNCKAVSPGGLYRGKWQMSSAFWVTYGGKAYASRADLATCAEQDRVAYRGWIASWWYPWGG